MRRILFLVMLSFSIFAVSQNSIKGTITDSQDGMPIPGANVLVKGTQTGTTTDFDGNFELKTVQSKGEIAISFLGYKSKSLAFDGKGSINLGTIALDIAESELIEIVITGGSLMDIAKDRKTPVAVSTIKASDIQNKLGNKEFVEVLATTPSVYATRGSGGFGDSEVTVRGFGQENIAVMINGMPVNDMENGRVFWSNWAGLSDVASAMQVQRGLGSSKLAIASVGGTINIVTKSSDRKEGGMLSSAIGNNNHRKFIGSYSTGLMKNGLSASVLLSSTGGNGYIEGTKYEGQAYFIGLGYKFNNKHSLEFTFTGAPQWHHQRGQQFTIQRAIEVGSDGEPNRRWNEDWGYLNGEEFNLRRNFYHKPIMSLAYDFKINESTKLSTIIYGSWGRGGGSGAFGRLNGSINYFDNRLRIGNSRGVIDYNLIQSHNSGNAIVGNNGIAIPARTGGTVNTSSNGISMISGINSHDWYGAISSINKKFGRFSIDLGVDWRTYKGIHVRNINNLLGASAYRDTRNINNNPFVTSDTYAASPSLNPFFDAFSRTIVDRDWDGLANWIGGFGQVEYTNDKISAFIQGAVSNQSFQRIDRFVYLNSDPLQKSEKVDFLGGNIKAGVNYNINQNHNVFVNAGYYSRQPFLNAIFPSNNNVKQGNLKNETIIGTELGYGFRSSKFNANVNVYRTEWSDRFLRTGPANTTTNPNGYINFNGVTQLHQGAELDFTVKPIDKLKINGMFSYGIWEYKGNADSTEYDNQDNVFGASSRVLYLDGIKVGNAAQTTAALGIDYEVLPRFSINPVLNYFDNLYGNLNPTSLTTADNKGAIKLPGYEVLDLNLNYTWIVGNKKQNSLNFTLNIANLLDKTYIQQSLTNIHADDNVNSTNPSLGTYASNNRLFNGVADANRVWFGFGRTWNFGIRYEF
jgi:outer membrane receptor protein involved in Fe transport